MILVIGPIILIIRQHFRSIVTLILTITHTQTRSRFDYQVTPEDNHAKFGSYTPRDLGEIAKQTDVYNSSRIQR